MTHDGGASWQLVTRKTSPPPVAAWDELSECTTCPSLPTYGDDLHPIRLPPPLRCQLKYAHLASEGHIDTLLVRATISNAFGTAVLAYCPEMNNVWSAEDVPKGVDPSWYLFVAPTGVGALQYASKLPITGGDFLDLRFGLFWRISRKKLLESTDAGSTWHERSPPAKLTLADLAVQDVRAWFVSGSVGWLYRPYRLDLPNDRRRRDVGANRRHRPEPPHRKHEQAAPVVAAGDEQVSSFRGWP